MPRPLRINFPNARYHVMNRGAGRRMIFKNDTHRMIFIDLLKESHDIFNVKVYAYCLMGNHYHLLVSTPDANLSKVMRHINGIYTQKFNHLLNTDGPLFRGRYKAQLVDEDCYMLIVSRYIHLNPVEAGLVTRPADYRWSSYPAYLGLARTPEWLSTDTIINQLSETKSLSHVMNYQEYVEKHSLDEINDFQSIKHCGPIIGSDQFKEKILSTIDPETSKACFSDYKKIKNVPEIELIIKQICVFYNVSSDLVLNTKRGTLNWPKIICMYICNKRFGHTLKEISQYMGLLRYETVSTTIRNCQSRMQNDPSLYSEMNEIVKRIRKKMLECKN